MTARAFTLLEVTLVLVLVVMLAAAGVYLLAPLQGSTRFQEGVERFEASLRMARGDAVLRGLRLRLTPPTEETAEATGAQPGLIVQIESQPLAEPGVFQDYDCAWSDMFPGDMVLLTRCQLTGSAAYRQLALDAGQPGRGQAEGPPMEAINFYPDGTSDSALFELAPPDELDTRRIVLLLDGTNASFTRHEVLADDLEDFYDQLGLPATGGE